MVRKLVIIIVAIFAGVAVIACGPEAWYGLQKTWHGLQKFVKGFYIELPEYQPTKKTAWLDQNWTGEQRNWFYHADQGTLTFNIPYEWFVALEQSVSLPHIFARGGPLSDPAYLDRFGFIPGVAETDGHVLPVGFARGGPMPWPTGEAWPNPQTKERMTGIGLTCAACHTGRFTYQNTAVIVDGGPALTNLLKMKQAIGLSLFWTRWLPWRFNRFAERVLRPAASWDDRDALRAQLIEVLDQYKANRDLEDGVELDSVEEGYARLDALNRIGNQVFSVDLKNPKNYAGSSAPVHYPRIWDAPWFDWVQYNAAIEQPMVRNAGEALGVSAMLNLTDQSRGLFASGVQVKALVKIEKLIAGNQPNGENGFSGLKSPEWPKDILPPIDPALAAEGEKLYVTHCQPCHLPPVKSKAFFESPQWRLSDDGNEKYLHVEPVNIKHIGTDPAQAEDMKNRTVAIPANLGIKKSDFGGALGDLVEKTVNYWYDQQKPPISQADRDLMNGNRRNCIQALLAYKVRPLDGVWATPPYLHNGSVPNIYALLSPVSERPAKFWLGNREYDPVNIGYRTDKIDGGFEFDTSVRGNHNTGHEFSDEKKDGVIGPRLSPDERRALVEYIKTL
jgi:mono/diheme cytochrome c family protein